MYEGVNNNQQNENPEEPFDYLAEARRMRDEREAKDKLEKESKDRKKREERLTKQLARSTAKREEIAEKGKDLEQSAEQAKELLSEVKKEVKDIQTESQVKTESDQPTFIATMGEGSIVEMNLAQKIGEKDDEGLLLISHDVEKVEEAITFADEVSAQAMALARARGALEAVESSDMTTHSTATEYDPVYDLGVEQQELSDRIQHTWDNEAPVNTQESSVNVPLAEEASVDIRGTESSSNDNPPSTIASYTGETYSANSGTMERSPDPVSPLTTGIKSSVAYVGGFLSGRSRVSSLRRSLDKTASSLRAETSAIKRDVDTIQLKSQTNEAIAPEQMETPFTTFSLPSLQPERQLHAEKNPEVHGTDAPAIPAWIKQLEKEIKIGKVAELKKWQHDILRIQHPDMLKQYEKLDHTYKESIKHQSKEVLMRQFQVPSMPQPIPRPGDLPSPLSAMPAFKTPTLKPIPIVPRFDYVTATSSSSSMTANGYLTIVIFGGIAFGALLIAVFGF